MANEPAKRHAWGGVTWSAIAIISLIWWGVAGQGSLQRSVLLVWLSLSSFMAGALVGFLFSSYGEESNTLGKIRDWLVGVITALTVAKAAAITGFLHLFAAGPESVEFAFVMGASITYFALGFFFMFFQREIILNLLLAQSRAERGKLEGSQQTGQVIQRFLARLPASVLSGVDYIDDISEINEKEAKQLKDSLYSPDVETFLKQAEEAAKNGSLDWDIASKAAYISYYRIYFQKDEEKEAEVNKALEWVLRALNMNPLHADLTMKHADILGALEDYEAAVAVLERLALRPEAPILVKQWLGYYLRFLPDRLDDAIRCSEEYHRMFPDESDTLFNISYAYAQKYCDEQKVGGEKQRLPSQNRDKALSTLKEALQDQPEMAERVRTKWTEPKMAFKCLLHDSEFRSLVGLPPEPSTSGSS